jgi:adenosylhomocysteinase
VMPMIRAAELGDVFCTVTGNIDVIRKEHFEKMKDGAMVCNAGHFDVEINLKDLAALSAGAPTLVRTNVQEYMVGGKRIYVLAEGRLVNLAAAEGHPASVMDMSFATQALASAWMATEKTPLAPGVYDVPAAMEERVATLKLQSMGIQTDTLTPTQTEYLNSWQHGT